MHQQMWKRLNKAGQIVSIKDVQVISVIQHVGETKEEVEDRISRWKAGDVVPEIKGKYKGGELSICWVRLVSPGERSDD